MIDVDVNGDVDVHVDIDDVVVVDDDDNDFSLFWEIHYPEQA